MSKYKVWTRILMTVSSICVLSTATVFAAASGSINDDGVNIRSAASIGSEIKEQNLFFMVEMEIGIKLHLMEIKMLMFLLIILI